MAMNDSNKGVGLILGWLPSGNFSMDETHGDLSHYLSAYCPPDTYRGTAASKFLTATRQLEGVSGHGLRSPTNFGNWTAITYVIWLFIFSTNKNQTWYMTLELLAYSILSEELAPEGCSQASCTFSRQSQGLQVILPLMSEYTLDLTILLVLWPDRPGCEGVLHTDWSIRAIQRDSPF